MKKQNSNGNRVTGNENGVKNFSSRYSYLVTLFIIFAFCIFTFTFAFAASPAVRVKDIAQVLGARENQLMGFGLVVGLSQTGDSAQTGFTNQALSNVLSKMGVVPQSLSFKSRNVAAVMVTANLPAFVRNGQKIDVTVSSVGDATSLRGGTLLSTPLQGPDEEVYAIAQGKVSVGDTPLAANLPPMRKPQTNAGYIPQGALVEKEVPVTFGEEGKIIITLNEPDFTTAIKIVDKINAAGYSSSPEDAGTIIVYYNDQKVDAVSAVSDVENLMVAPETVAKVVVNEKTGTIVIGENVRIAPVAVAYSGIEVSIGDMKVYSETIGSENEQSYQTARSQANIKEEKKKLKQIVPGTNLSTLVRALNSIGASPQDLISILQAIKKSGALAARLEII